MSPGATDGRDRAPLAVAGPWRQLLAALWLRRTMQRRLPWGQPALLAGGPCLLALGLTAASVGAPGVPGGRRGEVAELLPLAYLMFAVGAVVAAVASAGGRELVPRAQLVAYPYSPVADHLGTLLLAPLNLAWMLQAVGLALLTGVVAPWGPAVAVTGLVMSAWLVACTTAAQVVAWAVELVRTLPGGTWWLRAASGLIAVGVASATDADTLVTLLERTPTRVVSEAAVGAAGGELGPGLLVALALTAFALVSTVAGAQLRTLLARRPARDDAHAGSATFAPRPLPPVDRRWSDVLVWRRADWAAVRRAPPLRRGLVVLLLVPAIGAVLSRVPWTDLPLMTALVAAAAGMLFGVNAFSLDGSGATWRQTLPVLPRVWVVARGLVLLELVLLTGGGVILAAAAAADRRPTGTAAAAVVLTWITVSTQVVARCLRWSLLRPHHAELRTARDSPAPPGAMTSYSARLVLSSAVLGMALALSARSPSPLWPLVVALPALLLAGRSLRRTLRQWDDPVGRARVVAVVSHG